jgi:hypothetical protein
MYYKNMISSSKNKTKTAGTIIRHEMGKTGGNNQVPVSFKENNLVIYPIQTANVFNYYFINVVDSLQTGQADINHALKLIQHSLPQGFPAVINVPIM